MNQEYLEELIAIYYEVLHTGSFDKYYHNHIHDNNSQILKEKLNLLKQLEENDYLIIKISIGQLLNKISQIDKIPVSSIQTKIDINNSSSCPPLTIGKYIDIIKNQLNKPYMSISIHYDNLKYNHIFDLELYSIIDLNGLDTKGMPIINHLTTRIFDEKEPTTILGLNNEIESIPLNITFKTFNDVYYTSFSEDNSNTFYKAILGCLNKKHQKVKKK